MICRSPKHRARSPSCRSAALGRTASGTSAAATPMCRCICRNSPTICWSSSTWRSRRKPAVVGKFWLPGMWTGGGETPTWPKGRRYALHHGLVAGNLAYTAWRDGGLAIVDVARPGKAEARMPSQLGSAVRRRHAFAAAAAGPQSVWSSPTRPISPIAVSGCATSGCSTCACRPIRSASRRCRCPTRPTTARRAAISARITCGRTGPARLSKLALHLRHAAQCRRARLRHRQSVPAEARSAYFVPRDPERMFDPRPNRPQVMQSCDCFVDAQGVMYLTDSERRA